MSSPTVAVDRSTRDHPAPAGLEIQVTDAGGNPLDAVVHQGAADGLVVVDAVDEAGRLLGTVTVRAEHAEWGEGVMAELLEHAEVGGTVKLRDTGRQRQFVTASIDLPAAAEAEVADREAE